MWLVEPPVASSATTPLTSARSSTISPIGAQPCVARAGGLLGQRAPQRRARVDEARARQVQAHRLDHELVGVRGAVEGAGAGRVVGLRLGLEQLLAADLALRVQLADAALLARSGSPDGIGPAGTKTVGRWPNDSAPISRPGHDLVAHAEHQRAVEHVVRERDRGRHRDHVAAEQRQLHARAALRDAVAHRRHAARELGDAAGLQHGLLEDRGVALERLVGREHVVVGRDDRDVAALVGPQVQLLVRPAGGKAVGEVRAAERAAGRSFGRGGADALEVGRAGVGAARGDARGDFRDDWMHGHARYGAQALARKRLRSPVHTALTSLAPSVVTMADVARLAGVSVTTVSHVINGTRPASERDARARACGDRAHRLPPEHDRPGAGPRRHAVAGAGDQRALEPVLHRRRGRDRGRGRARRATRCCSATRARTPSTSCGSSARWPSARSTGCCSRRRSARSSTRSPTSSPAGHAGRAARPLRRRSARPGRLRQRAADGAARRAPDRHRAPADRDGDRHPGAEHDRRARARLPDGARAGRARRSTRRCVAEGGSQRDRAHDGDARAARPAGPADRRRQRQQLHDHRAAAGDRRARADASRTTSRWSRSTTSSGPTCSRRG